MEKKVKKAWRSDDGESGLESGDYLVRMLTEMKQFLHSKFLIGSECHNCQV
jgi:hypothetical protein